ncbi:Maltose/maltodextrin ABC transporter, substrate binding periplasmic protein MalE [[Actinomadura] parvosata subsp. kistnae]|uniref:Sugar ABC transporter substrate-binding protein n=1 Tax=[Actinomadura] parvosata subsp. kistnae TaxID=1909395 RepID=A0A1U9ZVR6_9ACTN|nr:extracellular solute-binding protein [Nonomuraea sp. ATCC 55076]AQZ62045.1 sugar ABC transporter substrate-binding protein [Nonomuraea sp. ATCC 55076]SPL89382.1 Maltose/maltodextrin ABC transporter, substrate binding periplasmic protein MalE [Actinomadura parvosata subsp. kistnae]
MKQRALWSALIAAALAVAGCGSATRTDTPSGDPQQKQRKLVVWDWKSGEPAAATYIEQAKADFAKRHPEVTVEFVAQPFDQYYTLLGTAIQAGKGPDVMLFNGGGQIRDRAGALLPLDEYVAGDKSRLAGWEAFSKDGKVYAAPVTLQGHPIYYNKALYEKAGLDPAAPPKTWDELVTGCAAIKKATGAACFALGNKEGFGIQFFLSGLGSGILTPREYDDWIAGKRDWDSPNVRRVFELWKQTGDKGLNNDGANSTAMFSDVFTVFETGKAAHIIGLMSDVGHWNDFAEFLPPDKIGVMTAPVVTEGATPSLPYDGGIGYAVAKWTKDPALAADLVRSLTSTGALTAFYQKAGAIASDTTIDVTQAGPAVAAIASEIKTGRPALHVALSSKTLDLMGRLSQQLLSGSTTVDKAVEQLAASDRKG